MKNKLIFTIILLLFSFSALAQVNIIVPAAAYQGKVFTIRIAAEEDISSAKATLLERDYKCYENGDEYKGVIGIPLEQKPGTYDLKISITHDDGKIENISKKIVVEPAKFPFSKFWLKPARNKLRAREIIQDEWGQIEKVLLVEAPVQHWLGKFDLPVEGPISQGFGHRQIINNKNAGNHRGVDIAVPYGTAITAPNSGKVVFADKLKAFGGTMVLDHGQGIHTLYFHLSQFIAKVGDEVEPGETIALSGNSGISSGAHLHWGMSVHNLRVDPMQWTEKAI